MLIETVLGGLTGLIGNAITGIFNYKTQKIQLSRDENNNKHELAMVSAETQAMIAEAKANIAVTRATVEGEVELADANVYLESQKAGNKALFGNKWVDTLLAVEGKWKIITAPIAALVAFMFGFVDFLRGLMRPALTAYLTGMSTWITLHAWKIMQMESVDITTKQAVDIFQDTTSIVIYLTVTCVTWWFGDRRMAKSIMQLKGVDRTKIDDDIKI